MKNIQLIFVLRFISSQICFSQTKETATFNVGATKIDITRKPEDLPANFTKIHDTYI